MQAMLTITLAVALLATAWCWHAEARAARYWRGAHMKLMREWLAAHQPPTDPQRGE